MYSTATLTADVDIETRPACADQSALFQHPLLEDAPANLSVAVRKQQTLLIDQACSLCSRCPVRSQCLYDAVVRFDIAGIVAGTTPTFRAAIRQRLGWRVDSENFDTLLGTVTGQHVEHSAVVRAHRANPNESLAQLADRLGCSLSTVKRHLRQERAACRSVLRIIPPSLEQVQQAFKDVTLASHPSMAGRHLAEAA
ncbi:MAG: WhiB family transcriptional regulator [Propionibacteriaceae bacterium]|nr:WhiB family transcriptional regulator [Propionibacteriaceae bacterium]